MALNQEREILPQTHMEKWILSGRGKDNENSPEKEKCTEKSVLFTIPAQVLPLVLSWQEFEIYIKNV